jgi:hypothetical protein
MSACLTADVDVTVADLFEEYKREVLRLSSATALNS